jgi:hypothetical protein
MRSTSRRALTVNDGTHNPMDLAQLRKPLSVSTPGELLPEMMTLNIYEERLHPANLHRSHSKVLPNRPKHLALTLLHQQAGKSQHLAYPVEERGQRETFLVAMIENRDNPVLKKRNVLWPAS